MSPKKKMRVTPEMIEIEAAREQNGAQVGKRSHKKSRNGIRAAFIIAAVMAFAFLLLNLKLKSVDTDHLDSPEDISLEENQEIVVAQLSQSTGNEITYTKMVESSKSYELLDETGIMMIPVGTEVITKLGATTTFSRLAAGDMIKLLIQRDAGKEVLLKIWIIG